MNKFKEAAKYYGENAEFMDLPVYDELPDADRHRRSSFAAMGELALSLEHEGITDDDVWAFFKAKHNVTSRKHFTPNQWRSVATALQGAKNNEDMLDSLVDQVKETLPKCAVYRMQPDKVVAKYEGAFTGNIRKRCQAHADATGHKVDLVFIDTDEVESFYPQAVPF